MPMRNFMAAVAAFLLVATGSASAQNASTGKPDGAGFGYRLPTEDGRCAVWMNSDQPAPGNDSATWSGACKNGWAEGLGLQTYSVDGVLVQQFAGHMRQGRWQGLGRLHAYDEDGLIAIYEGLFKDDLREGIFKTLFAIDHPTSEETAAYIRQEKVGREMGETYLQVRQFYQQDQVKFLCASPYDCTAQVLELGHPLPQPDPADPLNATLPFGGWRMSISSETTDAAGKTVAAKPVSMGMCFETGKVQPGKEPRHAALLFPEMETWQAYLKADYFCEDDEVELQGLKLTWRSTCVAPDHSETVLITQTRQITDKAMTAESESAAYKDEQRTQLAVRRSRMQHVGACTKDMVRSSSGL